MTAIGFAFKKFDGFVMFILWLSSLSEYARAYADDVAITSDSASGAEGTLHRLQFHSEAIGLKLNAAKTEVLHVGYESDPEPMLTLDGTTIDICDIYNYLGLPTQQSRKSQTFPVTTFKVS